MEALQQTVSNKTKMHNYQYDYVKLKFYEVDRNTIKWDVLIEHPTLKKHYTLNTLLENYHGKNFDMYIDKGNNVSVKMSIPYLLTNQNYQGYDDHDLGWILCDLYNTTGLNFPNARVLEFEYGAFEKIAIPESTYLSNIKGVLDYDLQKATNYMKMYGNKALHYKIYDAVANAKNKKTFTRGNFPKSGLIKHEIKIVDPIKVFGKTVTAFDLARKEFENQVKTHFKNHRKQLVINKSLLYKPQGDALVHMLFTAVKQMEEQNSSNAYTVITNIIDTSQLSNSQKSKRRKSLLALETVYNAQH